MVQPGSVYPNEEFSAFLRAGRPLLFVQTEEEDRLGELLAALAQEWGVEQLVWSASAGLRDEHGAIAGAASLEEALRHLLSQAHRRLAWLQDVQPGPVETRLLRDLYRAWSHGERLLVLSSPEPRLPSALRGECAFWRLPRPSNAEWTALVKRWKQRSGTCAQDLSEDRLVGTLRGMTRAQAQHALQRMAAESTAGAPAWQVLQSEKMRLVESMGTLQYIAEVPPLQHLGGLENLKDWLQRRRALLFSEDPALRTIAPKGILLMGVSGCGKSLCIKAISSAWNMPLFRLEMSRIFSGALGSPEHAFVESCKAMEELVPAVLWIDEIEMGLAASGSTAPDPVLSRIFAFFLTWMQEKPHGLFVAATANRIDLLPAEMIRKGRFDQVFFVDLPHRNEREEIFRIHLAMRGCDPERFDIPLFADSAQGWNGAEIEQCIVAAVTAARMEQRDLELKDLYQARKQIVPISTTMEEQVRHIRNWAYERAVRASADLSA
jgi:SpoVK/Ycf46/Vps4 family AAA+-type ATPase